MKSLLVVVIVVLVVEILEAPAPIDVAPGSSRGPEGARKWVLLLVRCSKGTNVHGTRDRGKVFFAAANVLVRCGGRAARLRVRDEVGRHLGGGKGEGLGLSIHLQLM